MKEKLLLADREFRSALATIDEARAAVGKEEYRLSFLNTATLFYNSYIDFLVEHGRANDALHIVEHSRARTLAEGLGLNARRAAATEHRPASPVRVSGRLEVAQDEVLGELKQNESSPRKRTIESGETNQPRRGDRITALNSPLAPEQISRQMGAVILEYWLKPNQSYLWAVTPNKIALFKLPADTEINAAVQDYRKALLGPRDPLETGKISGRKLYDMLVAPAQ